MSNIESTDKMHVNVFASLCAGYGLRKVVISPGSRNAPIIVAFHYQPDIECFVIPDERSAAYFAIGIAQYTKEPVGIICTSGTAALNFTPAMAEAYYQKIPLVAITADRPPEWVDQLDGQTINQSGIFANFTSFQAQLPVEFFSKSEAWHTERLVRDGFMHLKSKKLPIHFNIPLREPLYGKVAYTQPAAKPALVETVKINKPELNLAPEGIEQYPKILIILGMKRPAPAFSNLIRQITAHKHIVVLAETLSNIDGDSVFQTADALFSSLQDKPEEELMPDLVISFEGVLLSKTLKQWVRSLPKAVHWVVSESDTIADVFQRIDKIIPGNTENFLQGLLKHSENKPSTYHQAWQKVYEQFTVHQASYQNTVPWSDWKAFEIISKFVPMGSIVHLGNSSPVRYAQFFQWKNGIQFFSNRGTAGIDGSMSTAIGMASQTDKLVMLITGDVSFLYDSNALWNNYKKSNLKIIVINNKGGNIFSLIPGPDSTGLLNEYFTTHIPVSIEYLSKAFGISYCSAENSEELLDSLKECYAAPGMSILEIQTDPDVNTSVWKNYFKTIKNKLHHD